MMEEEEGRDVRRSIGAEETEIGRWRFHCVPIASTSPWRQPLCAVRKAICVSFFFQLLCGANGNKDGGGFECCLAGWPYVELEQLLVFSIHPSPTSNVPRPTPLFIHDSSFSRANVSTQNQTNNSYTNWNVFFFIIFFFHSLDSFNRSLE